LLLKSFEIFQASGWLQKNIPREQVKVNLLPGRDVNNLRCIVVVFTRKNLCLALSFASATICVIKGTKQFVWVIWVCWTFVRICMRDKAYSTLRKWVQKLKKHILNLFRFTQSIQPSGGTKKASKETKHHTSKTLYIIKSFYFWQ